MHEHTFTLEERARLSDEEALRRRFDARNLRALRWVSWLYAAFSLALVAWGAAGGGPYRVLLALVGVAIGAVGGLVLRRALTDDARPDRLSRLASLAEERARGFTLGQLAIMYVIVAGVVFGARPGPFVIAGVVGWALVTFRFQPSETVLLYVGMASLVIVDGALMGGLAAGIASVVPNLAIAMAVSLWISRRARIGFLQEWSASRTDAAEQLRIRDELGFARELQLSMLPREAPPVPWIEAAAISLPATEVGGDYYDYLVLDADRLVAVSGDVAGHGIASGIVLSGVRSGLALLGDELSEPAGVMRRLHRMVRQTLRHRMLVSLSILLIDRARGAAILTAAAHPPLFVRRVPGTVERIDTSSLPLGNGLGESFDQREIPFERGDVFVLQTDGVYETTSPTGEAYGFARIERALAAAGGSAAAIRDALLRDLWEFKGTAPQSDDVTIVVLKIQ